MNIWQQLQNYYMFIIISDNADSCEEAHLFLECIEKGTSHFVSF